MNKIQHYRTKYNEAISNKSGKICKTFLNDKYMKKATLLLETQNYKVVNPLKLLISSFSVISFSICAIFSRF